MRPSTSPKDVANHTVKVNKNSEAYNRAYGNKIQSLQIYQGLGQGMANMANQAGQTQSAMDNADAKKVEAQVQTAQAAQQAMSTGLSQTSDLANTLRGTMGSLSQDMSSIVSAVRL